MWERIVTCQRAGRTPIMMMLLIQEKYRSQTLRRRAARRGDPLFEEPKRLGQHNPKPVPMIQRRLSVGFNRATSPEDGMQV